MTSPSHTDRNLEEVAIDHVARDLTLTARLKRITWEADGVLSLDFVAPEGGEMPPFTPGAHVDLHLPDGTIRQYSLCGDPADRRSWRVGVREVEDGRASRVIHRDLRPGGLITLSLPRNTFPLVSASAYLFVAGGIGITPLLPMMRLATSLQIPWTLLFCTRRAHNAPFLTEARALGGNVVVHATDMGTRLDVATRLREVPPGTALYCCGPAGLMGAVEQATADWPAGCVHFEWFTARARNADASNGFQLVCAQSGVTMSVPPEKSVLQVLHEAGILVPSSCEQGVCGTCEVQIIKGEVDHRDSILSAAEQAANRSMMACVSRAKSDTLVLDL